MLAKRFILGAVVTGGIVVCLTFMMDAHSLRLCRNTLLLVLGTLSIAVPVGGALAWTLFRCDVFGHRVGLVCMATLMFVPLYLQVAGWQAGFGPQGWLQMGFRPLGSPALLQGWRGALWVHGVAAVPWITILVGLGLRLVPSEAEEAALLSASWRVVVRRISLPMTLPAVIAAAVWASVCAAGEMTVTDVFQIRTYAEEVFLGFAGDALIVQPDVPAQLRVLPGILLVLLTTLFALLISAFLLDVGLSASIRKPTRILLGRWRWPVSFVVLFVIGFLTIVPLVGLVLKLGMVVVQEGDQRIRTWSLAKACSLLATGERPAPIKFAEEFGWSLAIGNLASLAAVTIGGMLAWKSRTSPSVRILTVMVVSLCLAIPGPLVGLGIIRILNQREVPWLVYLYDRTILAPWLAMLLRCLPLTVLVLWHGLRSVPREITEAAQLDGTSRIGLLSKVVIPMRGQHFLCAWLVGLTVSIGDLATSILVLPPGVSTLATRIFGLVHYGVEDQLASLALCSIGLFAFLSTMVVILCRRLEFG